MKGICFTLLISLLSSIYSAQGQLRMSEFIGVNSNVAAYDQKYLSDLAMCTKWIREYHSWAHFEPANDHFKWDDITTEPQGYTWPDHNRFMDECQKLGINVLIDVLNKPSWAGAHRGAYHTGDGTKPEHYLERLEFIGQLVARYGAQKMADSLLKTADKVSGLNYIRYYEDDNEPDYWWENPGWPAEKYAVYCNAVHDGYRVEPNAQYPLLGIKSVDSTAVHVLAGLASETPQYIEKILSQSNGRVPFDVINIHTYCTDQTNGYSPEHENYGLEKKLGEFMNWCKATLPGMPVWLTEFGWDTWAENGNHSYVYAPPQQQANYILRSFFIALDMGFLKAFLFMDKDPNSTNTLQYSSSGLLTDKNAGLQKKPSYYYMATLQNVLGDFDYNSTVAYGDSVGDNDVYCFKFVDHQNHNVYALWTRNRNSPADNGAKSAYDLQLDYLPEFAYSILPQDKDMDGDTVMHEVSGKKISLSLSETPQFLVISAPATSGRYVPFNPADISIYPNPSGNKVNISLFMQKRQKVKVSVTSAEGKLMEVLNDNILEAGNNFLSYGVNLSSGMYLVLVEAGGIQKVEKVIIL